MDVERNFKFLLDLRFAVMVVDLARGSDNFRDSL